MFQKAALNNAFRHGANALLMPVCLSGAFYTGKKSFLHWRRMAKMFTQSLELQNCRNARQLIMAKEINLMLFQDASFRITWLELGSFANLQTEIRLRPMACGWQAHLSDIHREDNFWKVQISKYPQTFSKLSLVALGIWRQNIPMVGKASEYLNTWNVFYTYNMTFSKV